MHRPTSLVGMACMIAAAVAAAPVHGAADLTQLGLSKSQVNALNAQLTAPTVAPGIAFGSPVGFGAGWGQAFAGVGGSTTPEDSPDSVDGSASVGFGLLDPVDMVGLEITVTAISVKDQFGEDGDFSGKLHRVLGNRTGLAIGVDNASGWGAAEELDEGLYIALTHMVDLRDDSARHPWTLTLNVGAGQDGRFADPGDDGANAFGSIALTPSRRWSLIADWTGRDLNAGVSIVPAPRYPIVITAGAINLTERFEREVEFAGGIGWLHTFE